MAPTYQLLVAARAFAGAFGGVCGTVILSIVGDVVPPERRGRAMGMVMSSFSISSIIGVPAGLYVADHYSWHVPFYAIAAISAIVLVIVAIITPPLRGHMQHATDEHPVARTWAVMTHPDHQKSYLFMAALTCAGVCIFSYIPTYMVKNVGLTIKQLGWIYACGGLCTVFSMNWVGRWADRSGKLKVFTIISLSCAIPNFDHDESASCPAERAAICVSTLLMICMSARMVPSMSIMTGAVVARYRGGFMSINTSVQQFSMHRTYFLSDRLYNRRCTQRRDDEFSDQRHHFHHLRLRLHLPGALPESPGQNRTRRRTSLHRNVSDIIFRKLDFNAKARRREDAETQEDGIF